MEHFVTLFDQVFLPQGLALHMSMQRHIKDYRLWILCMEDQVFEILAKLDLENVILLKFSELETESLKKVKSSRSRGEYCWTVTPFAPRFVFESDHTIQRVTYLDADMWFRKPPTVIFDEFENSGKSLLFTDHAYSPEYDNSTEFGQFCVQFMIFKRNDSEVVRKWWEDKCIEWCFYKKEENKFGDQKYLDLWPVKFKNEVHILANKELILAPWNLTRFPYGNCVCFHFHGLRMKIGTRSIKPNYGPYKIPLKVLRYVYKDYINELWNSAHYLKKFNFELLNQSNETFKLKLKIIVRNILQYFPWINKILNVNKYFYTTTSETTIINASNIYGKRASFSTYKLIMELEKKHENVTIILPETGNLSDYKSSTSKIYFIKRYLPNLLSRVYECFFYYRFMDASLMYTLGDIPVRFNGRQILLKNNPNLLKFPLSELRFSNFKYIFSRIMFRLNKNFIHKMIVQNDFVKKQIVEKYNILSNKIEIVRQPLPIINLTNKKTSLKNNNSLSLFYPAVCYEKKSHKLLRRINHSSFNYLIKIYLTIREDDISFNLDSELTEFVGGQDPQGILDFCNKSDGLLFLSNEETYGLPLIEAIVLGKPVICPRLPYSVGIFGNHPDIIYFEQDNIESLVKSINLLETKLNENWKPDWSLLINNFPQNWRAVADQFHSISST